MGWPLSQDYNEAIQSPAHNFADPDLCHGTAVANALGLPIPCSGNFADVYQVCCPDGSRWAVKCFTRESPGLHERYQEISSHLRRANLPFIVDFSYLEQGIRVVGRWYPVLKMQWVEGLTLNQFAAQYSDKPAMLEALQQIWGRMARRLRAVGVAHCDLQHGNILLVPDAGSNSLALKLIDYDGMFVPALAGSPSGEIGHASYQHPQRLRERTYSLEVDRFPLLLIATALSALKIGGRALWEKHDNGDNLLFRQQDLEAPSKSRLFYELLHLDDRTTRFLTENLIESVRKPLDQTPLLEELFPDSRPAPVTPKWESAPPPPVRVPQAIIPSRPAPDEFSHDGVARERKRGNTAPLWIALAGSVALLGVVVGVIALVAHRGVSDPNKGPALVHREIRVDKTKRPDPGEKSLPPKDPVGEIRRFVGHAGPVVDVAFAPNGRTAASGGHDKTVRLWDVESGKELHRLDGHTDIVTGVCFTPDGLHVVSGSNDKTVRLWEVATGKEVRRFQHEAGVNYYLSVTADGERILSSSEDKVVHVWDLESGKELRRFGFRGTVKENVWILAFSTDGRRALASGGDNILRLWDVDKGTMVQVRYEQSPGGYISPDGRFVLGCGQDNCLRLYDLASGKLIRRFPQEPAGFHGASFSPDGQRVLTPCERQVDAVLWDVQSGRNIYRVAGNPGGISMIRFSPDGRRALSAGRDGSVRLWGLPD